MAAIIVNKITLLSRKVTTKKFAMAEQKVVVLI